MVQHDPHTPEEGQYECLACGLRSEDGGRCPECNGQLKNIAVTRE